jgi:hypothetical protein
MTPYVSVDMIRPDSVIALILSAIAAEPSSAGGATAWTAARAATGRERPLVQCGPAVTHE